MCQFLPEAVQKARMSSGNICSLQSHQPGDGQLLKCSWPVWLAPHNSKCVMKRKRCPVGHRSPDPTREPLGATFESCLPLRSHHVLLNLLPRLHPYCLYHLVPRLPLSVLHAGSWAIELKTGGQPAHLPAWSLQWPPPIVKAVFSSLFP